MATPMTYDQLKTALVAEGLTVKEVAGSRDRCRCHTPNAHPQGLHSKGGKTVRAWGPINGTMVHITGGGLGGRTPEQYIAAIIDGDKTMWNKAQLVTDPDGVVYLNSAGRSNHAGEISQKALDGAIAANFSLTKTYDDRRGSGVDGNTHFYGIENIAATAMTAAQRASSVKICAAIARHYGWTGQESVGHGECSSARTKADPNLDMGKFRKDVMAAVKAGTKPTPPTDPEAPMPKPVTLHGLHWNIAGSDIHNGYGARNATRGPDVGARALEIGFDVFLTCEAGQTNLRAGVNTVLGQHKPWYSHAKAIWASDDVELLKARKAYADNLYNYLKTVKYGAGIFGQIEGKKFGILEIHTDYRKPAKQAAQVKSLFGKFRKDCDALGIKHVNQLVVGDLNWDGTSGDDPFKALASYNFEEKGSHTAKTFQTGKHLDGVLAHEEAEVTVKVRDRVDLSDHFPVEFTAKLK